jgi:hypothetical protein
MWSKSDQIPFSYATEIGERTNLFTSSISFDYTADSEADQETVFFVPIKKDHFHKSGLAGLIVRRLIVDEQEVYERIGTARMGIITPVAYGHIEGHLDKLSDVTRFSSKSRYP